MEYEMLLLYIDNDFSVKCVFTIARLVILFCRNNGPLVRSLKTNRVTFFFMAEVGEFHVDRSRVGALRFVSFSFWWFSNEILYLIFIFIDLISDYE